MGLFSRGRRTKLDVENLEDRSTPATLATPGLPTGTAADGDASDELVAVSADGGAELFASKATNLVTGATDNNNDFDLFWRDTKTGTTKLVTAQAGTLNALGFGVTSASVPLATRAVLSRDGQRVAYVSAAQAGAVTGDVATQDQLNTNDVFWWRADTGAAKLVSVRNVGNIAVGNALGVDALDPAISDDGMLVAYGTNLDGGQIDFSKAIDNAGGSYDLFLRNMADANPNMSTTAVTRIMGTADLVGQYGTTDRPVGQYMSGDGRFFVYATAVPANVISTVPDIAGTTDVFVRDMNVNTTAGVILASVALDGKAVGNATGQMASAPVISRDGSAVVFSATANGTTDANRLVLNYSGMGVDLYARRTPFAAGANTKLVTAMTGTTNTGGNGFFQGASPGSAASYRATADGTQVLFASSATNLVDAAKDTNGTGLDVFVRNLATSNTEFVSVNRDGRTGSTPSDRPSISDDGRYVTFVSASPELASSITDTNGVADAFLRDRMAGTTRAISTTAAGLATGDGATTAARVAANGTATVFVSKSKNLTATTLTAATANLYEQALPLPAIFGGGNKVVGVTGSPDGQVRTYAIDGTGKLNSVGTAFVPFPNVLTATRTATADVNGDGVADVISAVGPGGGSLLRITDGVTGGDIVAATATYEATFTGGLFVAAADLDRDGKAEIILSPDVGGGGRIQIFSLGLTGLVQRANFFGIDDTNFRGGARVAVGDINNDGRPEVVVGAGFGGGPRVAVFDGSTIFTSPSGGGPVRLFNDFFAFPGEDSTRLRNGVFVAVGDTNGDGFGDMVFGGGPGGGPRVYILDGALLTQKLLDTAYAKPVANFFAFDSNQRGGVRVAVKDLDGDSKLDLVVGSGERQASSVRTYLGKNLSASTTTDPAANEAIDPFGNPSLTAGVFVG